MSRPITPLILFLFLFLQIRQNQCAYPNPLTEGNAHCRRFHSDHDRICILYAEEHIETESDDFAEAHRLLQNLTDSSVVQCPVSEDSIDANFGNTSDANIDHVLYVVRQINDDVAMEVEIKDAVLGRDGCGNYVAVIVQVADESIRTVMGKEAEEYYSPVSANLRMLQHSLSEKWQHDSSHDDSVHHDKDGDDDDGDDDNHDHHNHDNGDEEEEGGDKQSEEVADLDEEQGDTDSDTDSDNDPDKGHVHSDKDHHGVDAFGHQVEDHNISAEKLLEAVRTVWQAHDLKDTTGGLSAWVILIGAVLIAIVLIALVAWHVKSRRERGQALPTHEI